ncbi:metallophosphoesterase family protein [Hyphomonas sp. NPDC076900]|uniref:metallophosphoesterase family protein n=1 Tax=unclassified Hyphomonas TaxID=2630699 RepID=UPI003CFFCE3F
MMAERIFRRLRGERERPSGPPGKRAYVIGDVHGCLDLLEQMIEQISAHNHTQPTKEVVLVFLGDVIDRGPDSRGVIDFLRHGLPPFVWPYFVMGNHEESLLRGMREDVSQLRAWLLHGGEECAASYGVRPKDLAGKSDAQMLRVLQEHIPPEDLSFLASFHDYVVFGDYLFVHAGVRPGRSLSDQTPRDLRWIREPFLSSPERFGHVVVHGHSVCAEPVIRRNRICVDTGAYRSGVLSALMIDGANRATLQAVGAGAAGPGRDEAASSGGRFGRSRFGAWYRGAA